MNNIQTGAKKLYKAGGKWVAAAVVTTAIGLGVNTSVAQADTNSATATTQMTSQTGSSDGNSAAAPVTAATYQKKVTTDTTPSVYTPKTQPATNNTPTSSTGINTESQTTQTSQLTQSQDAAASNQATAPTASAQSVKTPAQVDAATQQSAQVATATGYTIKNSTSTVQAKAVLAQAQQSPNTPESVDTSSINTVDGYLSYSGWYRPAQIHAGGTTWQATTASDWRPLLMYVWPDQTTEINYLSYFLDHGYTSTTNGLTPDAVNVVANLSPDAETVALKNYATMMRDNIEAKITADGSNGISNLANTMNAFMATQPLFNGDSELPVEKSTGVVWQPQDSGVTDLDQITFVNNNGTDGIAGNTSGADSDYRLLNRTTDNQDGTKDLSTVGPELLVGNDIDNSNPTVQAENLNWEYFLLNYGSIMSNNANANFDGFRIDAADNMDADVLDQVAQLFNDMYGTATSQQASNDHLAYNEGYVTSAAQDMLNNAGNQQLLMDAWEYYTLQNTLGVAYGGRSTLDNLATNSVVFRRTDYTDNWATPNWSFVNNHDQQKNRINDIILAQNPNDPEVMSGTYTKDKEAAAIQTFIADMNSTNKQYAQYNLPAQYALLLTNKDTIPQVYYGDLYNEFTDYMSQKTIYYDAITTLMAARSKYVAGGQEYTNYGNDLEASVRFGLGNTYATDKTNTATSRNSGIAVVVGSNPNLTSQTIKVAMGADHANQQYMSLEMANATGITETPTYLTTDAQGNLTVTVHGYSNPQVSGYLSVWVPTGASATQNVYQTATSTPNTDGKTYHSNGALDSHVIFEDFSLYEPEPASTSNDAYTTLAANAQNLANMGITDMWMAPAYKSFSMARYMEGYAVADRYDLGSSAPTKYGTSDQLQTAITALHAAGMKVQADLVLNQMFGYNTQEAVTVSRTDNFGQTDSSDLNYYLGGKGYQDTVYFAYTKGGGDYQKTYGGQFLDKLQSLYPDLFTTKAKSTGEAPDPSTKIQEWTAKYQNGTSLQNVGIGMPIKVNVNGTEQYAYVNSDGNTLLATQLPTELQSNYDSTIVTGIQTIDGKTVDFGSNGIYKAGGPIDVSYQAIIFQDNRGDGDGLYATPQATGQQNTDAKALNGTPVQVIADWKYGTIDWVQIQLANGQTYWIDKRGITPELTNYQVQNTQAMVYENGRTDGLYLGGPYGTSLTTSGQNQNAYTLSGQVVTVLATAVANNVTWAEIQANGAKYWILNDALISYTPQTVTPYQVVIYQVGRYDGVYVGGPYGTGLTSTPQNQNAKLQYQGQVGNVEQTVSINGVKWDLVTLNSGISFWIVDAGVKTYSYKDTSYTATIIGTGANQGGVYYKGPFGTNASESTANTLTSAYRNQSGRVIAEETIGDTTWVQFQTNGGETFWTEKSSITTTPTNGNGNTGNTGGNIFQIIGNQICGFVQGVVNTVVSAVSSVVKLFWPW